MRPTRKRILSSEHMAQFDDEHKNAFGTTVDPLLRDLDYGSGWFAKTLEYKDWYELSNAKRVHQNYIESFPLLVVLSAVAGLHYDYIALVCVWLSLFGRIAYVVGYLKGGPQGRIIGALLVFLCNLTVLVTAFITAFKYI